MRSILIALAVCIAAAMFAGCGGGTTDNSGVVLTPGVETPVEFPGDGGPIVDTNSGDKAVTYDFHHIWTDTVNHQSGGRWTVVDNGGKKEWMLSNTCHSAPKSWIIGCKYYNYENDELTSNPITVNGPAKDIRLSFYSRWQIQNGDLGQVQFRIDGGPWLTIQMFTGGQNPSYPAWDKYYYTLPPFLNEGQSQYQLRFVFTSNSTGNAWGYGIDDVSVYQSLPEPPINVQASDGSFSDHIQVDWTDTGYKVQPDGYFVYRSDFQAGPYSIQTFVPFGTNTWDDSGVLPGATYWYKVSSVVDFLGESRLSLEDSGFTNLP